MPYKETPGETGEAAAAAFARVLDAERAAESAVAACAEEAARRIAAAGELERALAGSAAERVSRWQERLAAKVAARTAEIDRQTALLGAPAMLDATAQERIADALRRLAEELLADE